MTLDKALEMLYAAFSPNELSTWIYDEMLNMLDDSIETRHLNSEKMGRNLMLRMAIELSDDPPVVDMQTNPTPVKLTIIPHK